ncbi:MAG: hypothetical protein LBI57_01785 [Helicobacteraceae bacterium]|jgi:hypothetical protein|nr:hypothetical protein [Helicobacteraceae bacterium]
MAKRSEYNFYLFLLGATLSIGIGTALASLTIIKAYEIGWEAVTFFSIIAFLPSVLLGLPYLNEKFSISYSKTDGFSIREERRTDKRQYWSIDTITVSNSVSIGGILSSSTKGDVAVDSFGVASVVGFGDKAEDEAVVHKDGAETIVGVKMFESEPILPEKSTIAGNYPSKPATEAQIYASQNNSMFLTKAELLELQELGRLIDGKIYYVTDE